MRYAVFESSSFAILSARVAGGKEGGREGERERKRLEGVEAAAGVNRATYRMDSRWAGRDDGERTRGLRGEGTPGRGSVGCESQNRRMELLLLNRL